MSIAQQKQIDELKQRVTELERIVEMQHKMSNIKDDIIEQQKKTLLTLPGKRKSA